MIPKHVDIDALRDSPAARATGAAAAGAAIALIAWYPGHWLIILLVLPLIWGRMRGRLPAYLLWCGYYLAGARDIPIMTEHFFRATASCRRALRYGSALPSGSARRPCWRRPGLF